MDKIYINNLEFIAYHGVFPEEKRVNSEIITTSYRGVFEDDAVRRMEILSLLK